MNIVDEVVNKIDIMEGVRGMASILLWMFTKPHAVVSFPNVALCEVNTET